MEPLEYLQHLTSEAYEKRVKVVDHVFKFFTWIVISDGVYLVGYKTNDWAIKFVALVLTGLIVWCYRWLCDVMALWMISGIPIRYMSKLRHKLISWIVYLVQVAMLLEVVRTVNFTLLAKASQIGIS